MCFLDMDYDFIDTYYHFTKTISSIYMMNNEYVWSKIEFRS